MEDRSISRCAQIDLDVGSLGTRYRVTSHSEVSALGYDSASLN